MIEVHPMCTRRAYESWAGPDAPADRRRITAETPRDILSIDTTDDVATLNINGVIVMGEAYWLDEVGSTEIAAAINAAAGMFLEVRINSPGGSVWGASEIIAKLREFAGSGRVIIDGIAASAASMVAIARQDWARLAATELCAFLIHNPWGVVIGDYQAMKVAANDLEISAGACLDIYVGVAGEDKRAELKKHMDADTILGVAESEEYSFITGKMDAEQRATDSARHARASEVQSQRKDAETWVRHQTAKERAAAKQWGVEHPKSDTK